MKRQHVGAPVQIGEVTLTPITEIKLDVVNWKRCAYVWGSIRPIEVLISTNGNEERVQIPPTEVVTE